MLRTEITQDIQINSLSFQFPFSLRPVFPSRLPPIFPPRFFPPYHTALLWWSNSNARVVRSAPADLRGTSANSADARAAICKDLLFEFILSFLLGMTFRNET